VCREFDVFLALPVSVDLSGISERIALLSVSQSYLGLRWSLPPTGIPVLACTGKRVIRQNRLKARPFNCSQRRASKSSNG